MEHIIGYEKHRRQVSTRHRVGRWDTGYCLLKWGLRLYTSPLCIPSYSRVLEQDWECRGGNVFVLLVIGVAIL